MNNRTFYSFCNVLIEWQFQFETPNGFDHPIYRIPIILISRRFIEFHLFEPFLLFTNSLVFAVLWYYSELLTYSFPSPLHELNVKSFLEEVVLAILCFYQNNITDWFYYLYIYYADMNSSLSQVVFAQSKQYSLDRNVHYPLFYSFSLLEC